jgi:predicted transposase YbfD/YdcC
MLSAWCSAHGGLVIGQIKPDTTSNALPAIPALLQLFAITGCMVPIDALGCQTAIASQIQAQGGDSLLALQWNHKKADKAVKRHVHAHVEPQLAWRTAENCFAAFDNSHGRTVRRRVWTITDLRPPACAGKMAWAQIRDGRRNDSDGASAGTGHAGRPR